MEKLKYVFDENKILVKTDFVSDDYMLLDNETFTAPEPGLNTPVKLVDGKWVGSTEPEVELLDLPDSGSSTDKTVSELTLQIAQNKADQDTINAQLLLAAAQQTEKETN